MDSKVLCLLWFSGALFLGTSFYAFMLLSGTRSEVSDSLGLDAAPWSHEFAMTIITAPQALVGEVGDRQKMALRSWLRLVPRPKVVWLGQHFTLAEYAAECPHLTVESRIDFAFSGRVMFHAMVQRAFKVQSGIVLVVDPELILLPHVSTVLERLYALDHDWLLTATPRVIDHLPYNLQDNWAQPHGPEVDDSKVEGYVKANGNHTSSELAQLWVWNANKQPLHAGVMPPFVFKRGQHDLWLLGEALESKYRVVIDGSESLNPFQVKDWLSDSSPSEILKRAVETRGNAQLAITYGNYLFRPPTFSDTQYKLVKCGCMGLERKCTVLLSQQSGICSEVGKSVIDETGDRQMSKIVGYFNLMYLLSTFADQAMECSCGHTPKRRALPHTVNWEVLMKAEVPTYSLKFLLETRASDQKVVILAVVGNSYREMLMNWVCRLRHLNISNFLVSALDDDLYNFAVFQGLPVFKNILNVNVSRDDCHFGTYCFQRVTKMKSRTVLTILQLGYHVLFSDVDVHWFQDPVQELMGLGAAHLVAQTDQWNDTERWNEPRRLNSGFYFAWSDDRSIAAFQKIVVHATRSGKSEQPSFYDVLCGEGGVHAVGKDMCFEPTMNFTVMFLDPVKFPNGAFRALWEEKKLEEVCEDMGCRILHNNWIKGRKNKLERHLRSGLWQYDISARMCIMKQ